MLTPNTFANFKIDTKENRSTVLVYVIEPIRLWQNKAERVQFNGSLVSFLKFRKKINSRITTLLMQTALSHN